jgi:ubiquinone/menaquinone biosynthesis C-methylase UbiE
MKASADLGRERIRKETMFWRSDEHERPESDSLDNIVNKVTDCQVFLDVSREYALFFKNARTVLELGGGQGWACGALKKIYPQLDIVLSDVTEYAVKSRNKWERIFQVSLPKAMACTSYKIPFKAASIDIVFCYAAAHHFGDMAETLAEIHRVLTKGGHCLFLHEPAVSRLLYRPAFARVNKKRPDVPEDVIVYKELLALARKTGFKADMTFHPTILKRGPVETAYYLVLSRMKPLQRILPCTANFHFLKP